jgi:hypothetical protein
MSTLATNAITDASGGNTATINSFTPTESNMAGRNRIINGDMRIDQRNAGASVSNLDGFGVDRWYGSWTAGAGRLSAQQSTVAPAGFTNSWLLTVTATNASPAVGDGNLVDQRVEGFNIADLGWGTANAQSVTVSFWVRSSVTGTFGFLIVNSANARAYGATYTVNAANTFEYKTVTIPGDTAGTWLTNNGAGLGLRFGFCGGSSRTVSTGWSATSTFVLNVTGATNLMATSGATFYITGVQLEVGSVATPFEHRQYGQELALCRRYYAGGDGYMTLHPLAADGSGGYYRSQVYFDTPMRAAPTVSLVSSVNIDGTQAITTNKVGFYADGKANNAYCYSNDGFTRSAEL